MVSTLTGSTQDHVRCWLVSKAGTQAVSWGLETGMLLTLTGDLKPVLGRWCQRTCLECGDCSLHGRVDVGVVEIGQRAVFLEGGQQPGIGSG
jgi:hypothetical protein